MSHDKFEVGDKAVIIFSLLAAFPVGMEITVLGPLEPDGVIGPCHHIGYYKGSHVYAAPSSLRKLRPPPVREPVSTWDDVIVWKPREVEHV